MYAIVEIAGQQFKVEKDQQIFVHRLEGKEGSKVNFDKVLLTSDGKKVEVGAPAVKGVSVSAKIVEHLKGDKVIVFKKKRRKGYKVKNGHRQAMSKIQIEAIGASKAAPKAAAKKEEAPKAEAKAETKASTAKTATKKPAAKKTATKASSAKTTAKKSTSTAKKTSTTKAKPAAKKAPAAKKTSTTKAKSTGTKKSDDKKK
ncbi:MAG: 50S ribosomal protein L21 [Flavobacteriales bacterium]|nr:50S ribosomal protein L21 [Flavobacteriales bacterium]|tara:strand:+ start:2424 stop:3026 length:603 start_codon:yes stop_codon:yes gene_type:complete